MIPNVLTIAGSDSGGGAGMQADLKAFSALGVYGTSVITAVTAQNTQGITAIHDVPVEVVRAQIDAVYGDIAITAVKIGMLSSPELIAVVADGLERWKARRVVIDPVMVAKSGDTLLRDDAIGALRDRLLPLATVLTPNLPETGVLLDAPPPTSIDEMERAALSLRGLGAASVLVKGGHLDSLDSHDVFDDGGGPMHLAAERIRTQNTHGTGCTLSSAIAAYLARGYALRDAVRAAKAYVTRAIHAADQLHVGSGHGPVHHFHAWWPSAAREDRNGF